MTCPNCGTKYKGKQCPECGRWTTDFEATRSNRWKYGLIAGGIVLLSSVIAIVWAVHGTNQYFDDLENQLNKISDSQADVDDTVVTAEPADTPNLDERKAFKAEIMEIITGYGLPDTSEIVLVDSRIEISAPTEYSVDAMPETWEDILQETESMGASLQSELPDYTVTVMYKDAEGNILLNVTNGECKYNAFNIDAVPAYEEDNPPTITMAEYNQIETGMTYFQVCDIIGGSGELLSEVDMGMGFEYATEMYMWEGEGIVGANANVTFQGSKVIAKAQFGLE